MNIGFTLIFLTFMLFKLRSKKKAEKTQKEKFYYLNELTWFYFLLFSCFASTLFIWYRFLINNLTLAYFVEKIYITLFYIALIVKVISLELIVNQLKIYKGYFFTLICAATIVMFLVIDTAELKKIGILLVIFAILLILGFSLLPILYFYLAMKTIGESRVKSIEISAGLVFYGLGLLFRPEMIGSFIGYSTLLNEFIDYTYITSPVAILIGLLLIFTSQLEISKSGGETKNLNEKQRKKLEKAKKYLVGHFQNKPEEISEDEVSFYREKRICLVCKGKLINFIFICSSCDAFYCEKCARILTNIENTCWVCDSPFDPSKPTFLNKKEEIIVDKDAHKTNHK